VEANHNTVGNFCTLKAKNSFLQFFVIFSLDLIITIQELINLLIVVVGAVENVENF